MGWIVELPDGVQGSIPIWMTDDVYCAALDEGSPQVDVVTLLELAALLDAQMVEDRPLNNTVEGDRGTEDDEAAPASMATSSRTDSGRAPNGGGEVARATDSRCGADGANDSGGAR